MSLLDIDCLDPKIQIIKQYIVDWISEFGPCGIGMPRFVSGIRFSNVVEQLFIKNTKVFHNFCNEITKVIHDFCYIDI